MDRPERARRSEAARPGLYLPHMGANTDAWTRADWARWFIERDEVDEAARVLQAGDQLELGRSDYLGLAEALGRRGLGASYEGRVVRIESRSHEAAEPSAGSDTGSMTGALANGNRKPPARQTPVSTPAVKKLA